MLGRVALVFALCLSAHAEKKEIEFQGAKILLETGKTSDDAAKVTAESLQKVSQSLGAILALDGQIFRGRLSLTILKNMEGDKREAVRDMIARYKTAVSKINKTQNIVTLDQIFQNQQLRSSLQAIANQAVEGMTTLHANRWFSDHHTRNRISFLGQYIARLEWLVNDIVRRNPRDAERLRPLTDEITNLRGLLLRAVEELHKFRDAYIADGHYPGSDHTAWFDDAKATISKGEVKLGLYVYNAPGYVIGYQPYEGEFLSLFPKAETKETTPATPAPSTKPAPAEELPTPPPVKKEVPAPPKPMPPASPEDRVAVL